MQSPSRRALSHARRFPRPFWAMVAGGVVESLGRGVLIPFWALYLTGSLHASGARAGALLAIAGLVGLVGAPLGGALTDRIGRRRTLIIGLSWTVVWFAAYGAISDVAWLIPLSFAGIGADIYSASATTVIVDVVDPELRTEAFGLQRQTSMIAFTLGPLLGSLLAIVASLRWIFWVNAICALVYLLIVVRGVPETRPARDASELPPRLRHALRDRRIVLLTIGTGIGLMVYAQFDAVLGVFLHRDRGYALATWGAVYALSPILIGVAQYPVARWAGRRSARRMLAIAVLLEGLALLLLWPTSALPVLICAVVVVTAGEMLLQPIASTVAAALAPPHLRGSYEAVVGIAGAASWGPAVLAGLWLVGSGHGTVMLAAALPLSALAALCFRRVPDVAAVPA